MNGVNFDAFDPSNIKLPYTLTADESKPQNIHKTIQTNKIRPKTAAHNTYQNFSSSSTTKRSMRKIFNNQNSSPVKINFYPKIKNYESSKDSEVQTFDAMTNRNYDEYYKLNNAADGAEVVCNYLGNLSNFQWTNKRFPNKNKAYLNQWYRKVYNRMQRKQDKINEFLSSHRIGKMYNAFRRNDEESNRANNIYNNNTNTNSHNTNRNTTNNNNTTTTNNANGNPKNNLESFENNENYFKTFDSTNKSKKDTEDYKGMDMNNNSTKPNNDTINNQNSNTINTGDKLKQTLTNSLEFENWEGSNTMSYKNYYVKNRPKTAMTCTDYKNTYRIRAKLHKEKRPFSSTLNQAMNKWDKNGYPKITKTVNYYTFNNFINTDYDTPFLDEDQKRKILSVKNLKQNSTLYFSPMNYFNRLAGKYYSCSNNVHIKNKRNKKNEILNNLYVDSNEYMYENTCTTSYMGSKSNSTRWGVRDNIIKVSEGTDLTNRTKSGKNRIKSARGRIFSAKPKAYVDNWNDAM